MNKNMNGMKSFFYILIAMFNCQVFFSQSWQNMIPNYSFENHNLTGWNAGSNCYNLPDLGGWLGVGQYQYIEEYWSHVEELTLYIIQQQQEIEKLKSEMNLIKQ